MKTCKKCGATFNGKRCLECKKGYTAAYVARNADHVRNYLKNYRTAHKADIRQKDREYRLTNAEEISVKSRARSKEYAAANPDRIRANRQNRRALTKKIGGKLSSGIAEKLFNLQQEKCPCCGLPLGDNYHLDHIMPIALGGINEDSNIQLLRQRCNNQKYAKHPIKFMQERGFLL